MTREDRLNWRHEGREAGKVPYLQEAEGLPPVEYAPIELPESTRPLHSGLSLSTGEGSDYRARLFFVHHDNAELTARFLINPTATAVTFWDGSTGLDYQVPTDDVLGVIRRLLEEREWLLRTDEGTVAQALTGHLEFVYDPEGFR